jgi:hypothetical protein
MPERRRSEDRADIVEFYRGAVPRYETKWGHLAAGFAVGWVMGREIRKAGHR